MSDILKYRNINIYGTLLHRILGKKRHVISSVKDPNYHRIYTITESRIVVDESINEIREIVEQIPPMEMPLLLTKLKNELKNPHNLKIMNKSEFREFKGLITPYIEYVNSLNPQDYAVLKPLQTKEPVAKRTQIAVEWIGEPTKLYWVFAQMKKKKLIDNSFSEIGEFLKQNFHGLKANSATITREIQKFHDGDKIPKTKGAIDIPEKI